MSTGDGSKRRPVGGYPGESRTTPPVVRHLEHPERKLSLFFIATSGLFGLVGTTLGTLLLAALSGALAGFGSGALFLAHPYLQIYGFVVEFVVGVEYSLLPRFKTGRIPSVGLGYATYFLLTSANALFIYSSISSSYAVLANSTGAVLILAGSILSAVQVFSLASGPRGGFPETNPLIMNSSVSLVLLSLALLLEWQGYVSVDEFSSQMILLALVGFAGSMIYSVEIRSVSFRQSDYRKKLAKLTSALQVVAVAAVFLSIAFALQFLSVVAAALFFAAGLSLTFTIKIFEFSRPLMYRPAMTKMHFSILRFNEVGIISGSVWLIFGLITGIILVVTDSTVFFLRDSFIHSIAIGFIGSSIVVFAPMLLPGLLGRRAPTSGLSYGPIVLLNAGLILRIAGNATTLISAARALPIWESFSGPLILGAIVWFFVVLHNVGKRRSVETKRTNLQASQHSGLELNNVRDATIRVTGAKTGRERIVSVWFVKIGSAIYLLPLHGDSSKWFRSVLSNPQIKLEIGGHNLQGEAKGVGDTKEVNRIVDLFEDKYGERVYRNFYGDAVDRAVVVTVRDGA